MSWAVLNFILVIYSNSSQLSYSILSHQVITRKVLLIEVYLSFVEELVVFTFPDISWNWLIIFLGTRQILWCGGSVNDIQSFWKQYFLDQYFLRLFQFIEKFR